MKAIKFMLVAFVATLALSLTTASCGKLTIEAAVAQFNEKCPQDNGDGTKLASVKNENGYINFNYEVDETKVDFANFMNGMSMPEVQQAIKDGILKADGMQPLTDLCKETKTGFKLNYKGAQSGESATITIESTEL